MSNNNDPLIVDSVLLEQAEKLCKQRLQNDPANRAIHYSLADVYRKQGKVAEAGAVYDRLFQLDPQDQKAGYLQAVMAGKEWPTAPTGMCAAPFVVLKNFLSQEFHDSLLPFLLTVRERFVPGLIFSSKGEQLHVPSYRESLDFTDKWENKKQFASYLREIVPALIPRLYVTPFEVDKIELHVHTYLDGHFYKVHMDAPRSQPNLVSRMLGFTYYFHRVPRRYTGGELLLFDTDLEANRFQRSHFTAIVPEDNTLVVFPSRFYHCVVPVRCPSKEFEDSRFVINGFVRMPAATAAADAVPAMASSRSGDEQ